MKGYIKLYTVNYVQTYEREVLKFWCIGWSTFHSNGLTGIEYAGSMYASHLNRFWSCSCGSNILEVLKNAYLLDSKLFLAC